MFILKKLMQLLASLLVLTCELALTSAAKVVPFSIRAKTPRSHILDLSKRDTLPIEISNERFHYSVALQIGNPPQEVQLRVATGLSDIWLMDPSNPSCSGASGSNSAAETVFDCNDDVFFNPSDSSSWTDSSTEFNVSFHDTTVATGSFGQDDISINGAKITKANFAVASWSNRTDGVFGIGPRYGEGVHQTHDYNGVVSGIYDNFPIQMKQQGLISSVSYSLYLDHKEENTGTLLFGGVDHAKYKGNLGIVPVMHKRFNSGVISDEPTSFAVMLNGLGVKDNSGNSQWLAEFALAADLDSDVSYCKFPAVIIEPIARALNASYTSGSNYYLLRCQTAGSIMLDFSGVQVEVLVEDLITPAMSTNGGPFTDNAGNPLCYLGFDADGRGVSAFHTYVVGNSILRGLYVVYDLENWEVGIATGDLDNENSDIEEIAGKIPRGSSAPSYSSMSPTGSYSTASKISVFLTQSSGRTSITETEDPTGTELSSAWPSSETFSSARSTSARSSSAMSSSARSSSARSSSTSSSSARSSTGDSSGGTPFVGAGPSFGGFPGAASSFGNAGSAAGTMGGGGPDGGASRSTANLWLAGIFVLLL